MAKKLTQEEFIQRAKAKHGDKYDYSKVEYGNCMSNVTFICPIHGEFKQTPTMHLRSEGCRKCQYEMLSRKNSAGKDDFIEKSIQAHGYKYDYSKVEYKNRHTKVVIVCPEHGEFEQDPHSHIRGNGCSKCGRERQLEINRLTNDEFLNKVKDLPLCKDYDFSEMGEYVNNHTKIKVICPKHGEFRITPSSLTSGQGCAKCGKERTAEFLSNSQEDFIRRARQVHGWKYDYSKTEYKRSNVEVCIICPKHGEFWQTPNKHISGHGCPVCSGTAPLTTERFLQRAREVHGDKYDYSQVDCNGKESLVNIICPKHGEFIQRVGNHLSGAGCPKCKESRGERLVSQWLDKHNIKYFAQYRIHPNQMVLFGRNYFKVDFYIEDLNTIIEYHGRQHYEVVTGWGLTKEYLDEQQDRDNRLRIYCKENKIRLIEIPYTEMKNIDTILSNKLGRSK